MESKLVRNWPFGFEVYASNITIFEPSSNNKLWAQQNAFTLSNSPIDAVEK